MSMDLQALVARLRHRADVEDPEKGYDLCELPPEITWPEMAEMAALCREAADAIAWLAPFAPLESADAAKKLES